MERSDKNSGKWLVTYSDLVTLLLVFFVLLYMLTPGIDESTFDNFVSHFQKSTGIMEQPAVQGRQSSSLEDYRQQIMEQWKMIEDFLEQHGLSSRVDVDMVEDGVRITLSDDMTFNSGSSELLPEARLVLSELAGILSDEVEEAEVQGHTDNVPLSAGSNYRTNWHLGAARSVSVLLFLQERTPLDAERFRATSFGEYRPVASNEMAEGRRQNRRVEIYVRYSGFSRQDENEPGAAIDLQTTEPLSGQSDALNDESGGMESDRSR